MRKKCLIQLKTLKAKTKMQVKIASYLGSLHHSRSNGLGGVTDHADPAADHADPAADRLADGPERIEGDALLPLDWPVVFGGRTRQGFLFDQGFS
jgi:hypothetical protein